MTSFWNDFPGMPESLNKVSGIIRTSAASQNPIISEGLATLFDGKGKLLRPGLLLLASEFGKRQDKHYKLAACLEMLHIATLIHDDIIDDSPLRRGMPAVHVKFGKRNAVLIGDYLLSRCFLLAAEYTSPKHALSLAQVISIICGMEIEQNSDRFRFDVSLRRYFRKIMGKSAMLFSLACHIGASEAKVPKLLTERLRRIGYNMGMAFQIIDDILDYSGDPELVRKPLGNDIKSGLVTLPLICALNQDSSGTLLKLLPHFSPEDAKTIVKVVTTAGGVEAARDYAAKYTNRALRELERLPAGKPKDMLERLTRRLLVRNN